MFGRLCSALSLPPSLSLFVFVCVSPQLPAKSSQFYHVCDCLYVCVSFVCMCWCANYCAIYYDSFSAWVLPLSVINGGLIDASLLFIDITSLERKALTLSGSSFDRRCPLKCSDQIYIQFRKLLWTFLQEQPKKINLNSSSHKQL